MVADLSYNPKVSVFDKLGNLRNTFSGDPKRGGRMRSPIGWTKGLQPMQMADDNECNMHLCQRVQESAWP